ncbi:MAG: nuclear transport factor 2 family protein [Caulobacterales bacterium]|jgi:limonene-1,2-epoxide hydrolase|nr:nuclear transport factor 2 family protein [Caulobacterales bacterium]
MDDNESIVRQFIADWSSLDADKLVEYFTEDGVYHNMPAQPVAGREKLRRFIAAFLSGWERTDWEILNLIGRGDVVIAERLDRTVVAGKPVDLPCCGVYEMRDGKIAVWRDYFDMATYTRAIAG